MEKNNMTNKNQDETFNIPLNMDKKNIDTNNINNDSINFFDQFKDGANTVNEPIVNTNVNDDTFDIPLNMGEKNINNESNNFYDQFKDIPESNDESIVETNVNDETFDIPLNMGKQEVNNESNNFYDQFKDIPESNDDAVVDAATQVDIERNINEETLEFNFKDQEDLIYDNSKDIKEINKSYSKKNNNNKKTKSLLFTLVILIIGIVVGLYLLFSNENKPVVDDFKTKTVEDVKKWQEEYDIDDKLIIYKEEFSESYKEGSIISQSLNEGETLEVSITFTISKGFDPSLEVDMIDFKGLSKNDIEKFFKDNHFTSVSYIYEVNEDNVKDKFLKINLEDKKLARNSNIVITLSAGSAKDGVEIKMPNFANQNKSSIDIWAKDYLMKVNYTYQFSDTIAAGMVISFSPEKDTTIKTNSSINVTISKGKKITVLDFVGKKKSELEKWIKDNKLTLNKYKEVYSSKDKDIILEQSPKPKSELAEEGEFTATISIGKVNIKNHVNVPYTTFEKWLNDINSNYSKSAKITVDKKEMESSIAAGSIAKMTVGTTSYTNSSNPSVSVNPETKITVYVSKGVSVTVADKRGTSESDFKSYITNLGLKHSKTGDIYSTYAAGTIAQNDTGSKIKGSTVNYKISLGTFSPNLAEYNNKTIAQINAALKVANDKGAGWKFTKIADVYSDTVSTGKSLNCVAANKEIKCDISKGKKPLPVNVVNKSGASMDEFTVYINSNKLKLGDETKEFHATIAKGHIISNDTGSKPIGTSINYVISMGPEPELEINSHAILSLQGSSFEETKNKIHDYLSRNNGDLSHWTIEYKQVVSTDTAGRLIAEIPNGSYSIGDTITFKISIGNSN